MAGCVTPESETRRDTGMSASAPLFLRKAKGASLGLVQEGGTGKEVAQRWAGGIPWATSFVAVTQNGCQLERKGTGGGTGRLAEVDR